MAIPEGSL
jgi:hypothetical protein